eukprot:NODE_24938_length_227_cov_0.820225_g23768_i0.p1 GENE.NODE_24938_length_227_cov_0.820225_g23768_i0~~NODE_24938_length_227_cov_0.820225_g23768_i0.p1  ORF type:complete len:75 (+),score=9.26 NODE_24938_length_227_cov_0.820225_g23768_i0:26-226(+)
MNIRQQPGETFEAWSGQHRFLLVKARQLPIHPWFNNCLQIQTSKQQTTTKSSIIMKREKGINKHQH